MESTTATEGSSCGATIRPERGARALRALAFLACVVSTASLLPRQAAAAPPENMPVWRAQLTVRTCASSTAGTNDPVFASLNTNNLTALDYGRNDFPVDNSFTYDLVSEGVSELADVTRLRVSKTGSNGLCIRRLDLRVNNLLIFTRTFNGAGFFLDGGGGTVSTTITGATMRQSQTWQSYVMPFPPFALPRQELESRVEALVGTQISGRPVRWGKLVGPRFVEESRLDANTIRFDLDLELDTRRMINATPGLSALAAALNLVDDFISISLPNPAVDVRFNTDITCGNGQLDFAVGGTTVSVDTIGTINLPNVPVPGIGDAIDLIENGLNSVLDFAEELVEDLLGVGEIEAGFAAGLNEISFGTSTPICPNITVQQNGDVTFSL